MTAHSSRRFNSEARRGLRPAEHPEWVATTLATLTNRRFGKAGWLFERKPEASIDGCLREPGCHS